ncbi:MAG: DNA primase [Verrucomicrobiota bacterium]
MAISQDTIDRIRQAVDIVDVIDSYVPLKRAGTYYKALSPFNKEKTPSFFVSPDKQSFKCYSSGHGGDVFKFLMLYENLDFPSSIRRLAERAGIEIREERGGENQEVRQHRDRLLTLHSEVMSRWRHLLLHEPKAEGARHYMTTREIPLAWVEEFDLGYAMPGWDDILVWGRRKGYSDDLLVEAGLAIRNEKGRVYDRFRDRLVFAIHNDIGQIIGFSARALGADAKEAKYINSPETPLFTKSKVLFGFNRAKRPILDQKEVILCEGQIDVLRCQATGIGHVVAPLGTSFTEDHARMIKRHAKSIVLCLDADKAGQRAASRAADILLSMQDQTKLFLSADLGIRVIKLPQGHDPDSLIREQGVEAMQAMIANPMEYIDFLVDQHDDISDERGVGGKEEKVKVVSEFLVKIPNKVRQQELMRRAALRLDISYEALESQIKSERPQRRRREEAETPNSQPIAEKVEADRKIREILTILTVDSTLIPEIQRHLDWTWFEGKAGVSLLKRVIDLHNDELWVETAELFTHLNPGEQNLIAGLAGESLKELEREALYQALNNLCRKAREEFVLEKLRQVNLMLRQEDLSGSEQNELLAKQAKLLKLKKTLTENM